MLSCKFSRLGLLCLLGMFFLRGQDAMATFPEKECLNADFSVAITHKSSPFGLTQNHLGIDKKKCLVTVEHTHWKWFKKRWLVDVCREPIHIKEGTNGIRVLKREQSCTQKEEMNKPFCRMFFQMEQILQDDGLIFAEGEKEDLSSEHGKVYCAYSLIRKYLYEGSILSRFDIGASFSNLMPPTTPLPPPPPTGMPAR